MNLSIKKIILSNSVLRRTFSYFYKKKLKRKFKIEYGKNVFISYSSICEGMNFFDNNSSLISSKIGYGSYLAAGTHLTKVIIGKYTSIGPNVNCIYGNHPTDTFVSTHPAFFSINRPNGFTYTKTQRFSEFNDPIDKEGKYSILIGNDVWIGANVSLLDGIKIGDGAIIASNALVNKDVAPYTIVGGVPAKPIKKRFDKNQVNKLLNFKWWNKPEKWILENVDDFSNIDLFLNKHRNE